jgi:DNA-binding NtrC family response regulator
VFLDEVGEIALGTQAKLLRVLEERTVMRLGSHRTTSIDVRFVAATNRDLESEANAGRFRQDLFFRLNGISLVIPPLRERPLEIELLANSFLGQASRELDRKDPLRLSARAVELLKQYRWPGNVRELRNAIQRAAVLCPTDVILPDHLPPALKRAQEPQRVATTAASDGQRRPLSDPDIGELKNEIKSLERARIAEALDRTGGNQTRAAEVLGISRRTLVSRLSELGLRRPRKP